MMITTRFIVIRFCKRPDSTVPMSICTIANNHRANEYSYGQCSHRLDHCSTATVSVHKHQQHTFQPWIDQTAKVGEITKSIISIDCSSPQHAFNIMFFNLAFNLPTFLTLWLGPTFLKCMQNMNHHWSIDPTTKGKRPLKSIKHPHQWCFSLCFPWWLFTEEQVLTWPAFNHRSLTRWRSFGPDGVASMAVVNVSSSDERWSTSRDSKSCLSVRSVISTGYSWVRSFFGVHVVQHWVEWVVKR